jgi:hypothetical protein
LDVFVLPIFVVPEPSLPVSPRFKRLIAAVDPAVVLILKASKAAVTPIVPLRVKAPVPLCIVKLSVPPAPSIVELKPKVPSLVLLSEVTVTPPETVTGPVKLIFGFAASAVSIVIPLPPPVNVIPSRPVTATLRISSALPIFPVIFTVQQY